MQKKQSKMKRKAKAENKETLKYKQKQMQIKRVILSKVTWLCDRSRKKIIIDLNN